MNSPDSVEKSQRWVCPDHGRMMAELARRQTSAQIEATQAQKTASEAEEKAAMRPD